MADTISVISTDLPFNLKALNLFTYQYEHLNPYREFCNKLSKTPDTVKKLLDIPFYPIRAFKEIDLISDEYAEADLIFKSSGTSLQTRSRHLVAYSSIYKHSIIAGFKQFYDLPNSTIIAYLPGYSDNPHSSLVWMLNVLVEETQNNGSLIADNNNINSVLTATAHKPIILFGAAFGLLDLLEKKNISLHRKSIVIETGGMKTFRREMNRNELHRILSKGFNLSLSHIHSEYGMAELLSQSYMTNSQTFKPAQTIKFFTRKFDDPFKICPSGEEGQLCCIDLANIYSCAFIETEDRGVVFEYGSFTVNGRVSKAELRGCNFLIDRD